LTSLAAKLKTPLQIGLHLVGGGGARPKPIHADIADTILSRLIDDFEPQLTRSGYDISSISDQFDVRPAEIRQL